MKNRKFFVKCSYIEIYNDLIFDLLRPTDKLAEFLSIGEDLNVFMKIILQ